MVIRYSGGQNCNIYVIPGTQGINLLQVQQAFALGLLSFPILNLFVELKEKMYQVFASNFYKSCHAQKLKKANESKMVKVLFNL
jgi:hypothetical protein